MNKTSFNPVTPLPPPDVRPRNTIKHDKAGKSGKYASIAPQKVLPRSVIPVGKENLPPANTTASASGVAQVVGLHKKN